MEIKVRKIDVDSDETREELEWFRRLFQSCYGPFGKCALFPSPAGGGGVVCLTSRAERLLQMIKTKNPALKVMVGGLESHVNNYRDSGVYSALLATNLVMSGMLLEKPRYKVAMATSHTLSMVSEWLRGDSCPCKVTLSLTSSKQLMALVRGGIVSKSYKFGLANSQVDHISSLLLQAFLHALPAVPVEFYSFPAHVHVLTQSGCPLEESVVLHGVSLVTSDTQLIAQIEGESDVIRRGDDRGILTAVFDVSLAGDSEEDLLQDLSLHSSSVSVSGRESVEAVTLDHLLRLSAYLVERGVGMVGCQKCVHPLVKERLREHGVLVIERLSSVHIQSVREVTGGQMNSLLTSGRIHLGRLRNVRLAKVGREKFILLEGFAELVTPHCTVVLCTPTESMGEELAPLCNNIICLLEQSLTSPYSLFGGGCTDTVISSMILEKAKEDVDEDVLAEIECDQSTYSAVLKSISKCFSGLACSLEHCGGMTLTDSSSHHCWSFPPYDYCTPLSLQVESSLDRGVPFIQPCTLTPTTQSSERDKRTHAQRPSDTQSLHDQHTFSTEANHQCFSDSQLTAFSDKTCRCGVMSIRNLPPSTKWTSTISNDSISVPDSLCDMLRSVTQGHDCTEGGGPGVEFKDSAGVLDFGLAKVQAIETAGDLASTVLQIAYSLTDKHE